MYVEESWWPTSHCVRGFLSQHRIENRSDMTSKDVSNVYDNHK